LLQALSLHKFAETASGTLSGGNKRKLSLAIALIGGTKVILLDEPTAGMDPVARHDLWQSLKAASTRNSIVLTTHHLEEVETLADRVGIMVAGKLQCIGSLQELKAKFAGSTFQLQVSFAQHCLGRDTYSNVFAASKDDDPEKQSSPNNDERPATADARNPARDDDGAAVSGQDSESSSSLSRILPGLATHASNVDAVNADDLLQYLRTRLPGGAVVQLAELNGNKASLSVSNCNLSDLFDAVEERKRDMQQQQQPLASYSSSKKNNNAAAAASSSKLSRGPAAAIISEYSLSQSTLEQVFLRIGAIARGEGD
jgi:energy-coupling factor transporter ATP-binding protein EcfA2